MKKVNYAAIDIGSNAVRLLIKSVNEEGSPEGLLRKVQLIRIPLRLGEDAFTTGEISEGKAEKLIRLMKAYNATDENIRSFGLPCLRHICHARCTQRKRNHAQDRKENRIRVEIIDGQEEAHTSTITTSNSFLLRARIICMSMSAAAAQKQSDL